MKNKNRKLKRNGAYNITEYVMSLIKEESLDIFKADEYHFGVDINHYNVFVVSDGFDCYFEDDNNKSVVEVGKVDKEDVLEYLIKKDSKYEHLRKVNLSELELSVDDLVLIRAVLELYVEYGTNWEIVDTEFAVGVSVAGEYFNYDTNIEY